MGNRQFALIDKAIESPEEQSISYIEAKTCLQVLMLWLVKLQMITSWEKPTHVVKKRKIQQPALEERVHEEKAEQWKHK